MNYQDKLIREIAKENNLDWRVVQAAVYSPLKFVRKVVEHPSDMRPVRIMYFGVFMQKLGKHNKAKRMERKVNKMLENIDEVALIMSTQLGFIVKSADSAKRILNDALESKDVEKIDLIWNEWQETKKQ